MTEIKESALAARWRDGDQSAWAELQELCFKRATAHTRTKGLDGQRAEAVVADLFSDFERKRVEGKGGILNYDPERPFWKWFITCLDHALADERRRERAFRKHARMFAERKAPSRGGTVTSKKEVAPQHRASVLTPQEVRAQDVDRLAHADKVLGWMAENQERRATFRAIWDRLSAEQRDLIKSFRTEKVSFLPGNAPAEPKARRRLLQETKRAVVKLALLFGFQVDKSNEVDALEAARRFAWTVDYMISRGLYPPDFW